MNLEAILQRLMPLYDQWNFNEPTRNNVIKNYFGRISYQTPCTESTALGLAMEDAV